MGGEGAMMAMITSLKNNSRRHRRTQFDKDKVGGYGNGEKVEFDFPEVTHEVLKKIKDRLQKERKQTLLKRSIIFVIITMIVILIIMY